jgi:hypothetical protein
MTPSGIEPAIFRFVAQYLNHCATAVPVLVTVGVNNYMVLIIIIIIIIIYLTANGLSPGGSGYNACT